MSVKDTAKKRTHKAEREFYFKARVPCSQPSSPPPPPVNDLPQDEPAFISEATVTLDGAVPGTFNAAGTPITFRLSCPIQIGSHWVQLYDNGMPVPFESLVVTANSITWPAGIGSGRHELNLLAIDTFGAVIEEKFVLWAGTFSLPTLILDEAGAPVAGATVTAKLSDDPKVAATLTTDAAGRATFTSLPDRSFNILAQASGNRIAARPASVSDGLITLQLLGFKPVSTIDNNDFSQGTAGWDIGTAPVTIVPHVEGPLGITDLAGAAKITPQPRTAQPRRSPAPLATSSAAAADFDLRLSTFGEGQQSISRTFVVEDGIKSVTVRFRFVTSEVPGGYFGTKYNDFYNVSIRTLLGAGHVTDGNSMNGLGLAAFDAAGATAWFETELPIADGGDTVQVDIAVANVADGFLDSDVIVEIVKKKKLTISSLSLMDIDNTTLGYLSASSHGYFGGNTRVHGTIVVKGPRDDSLEELKVEVMEGGVVATGTLASGLAPTLYRTFDATEEIRLDAPQLLFEIPGGGLAGANQTVNGALTLRVKARSASGETAEKDFNPVTKLVLFSGARYGGRDAGVGGDDWAKPTVAALVGGVGMTWGDFSNMNGGPFAPHASHQSGNSADGWFQGYNARDAATAATIIGHLNAYGTRIRTVYVTFAAGSAFANAIANVTLNDGRAASSVIRSVPGHTTHFHWEVTD